MVRSETHGNIGTLVSVRTMSAVAPDCEVWELAMGVFTIGVAAEGFAALQCDGLVQTKQSWRRRRRRLPIANGIGLRVVQQRSGEEGSEISGGGHSFGRVSYFTF